jgi:hypothetical protein
MRKHNERSFSGFSTRLSRASSEVQMRVGAAMQSAQKQTAFPIEGGSDEKRSALSEHAPRGGAERRSESDRVGLRFAA